MKLCVIMLLIAAQINALNLEQMLADAALRYDLDAAQAVVTALGDSQENLPTAEGALLHAEALLLVAELNRIDFEQRPDSATKERRLLGKRIDAAAKQGLAQAAALPDSTEKFRLRADLIGTMIRSQYRAGKWKGKMKAAIEAALKLDPDNAKAYVSRAKLYVFKPTPSEEDLRQGLNWIAQAQQRDPVLESAALLQARTYMLQGRTEEAEARWRRCVEINPTCAPALNALAD